MADHAWVQENLDAYVLGGLSIQERSRVDRHMETCSACAHVKAEITEMEQLMDGIFLPVRADAGLEDRAIQKLRQARKPRPSWLRFVAAAAAVLVLGLVGAGVQIFALDGTLPLPGVRVDAGKNEGVVFQKNLLGFLQVNPFGGDNDGRSWAEGKEEKLKEQIDPVNITIATNNLKRLTTTYYHDTPPDDKKVALSIIPQEGRETTHKLSAKVQEQKAEAGESKAILDGTFFDMRASTVTTSKPGNGDNLQQGLSSFNNGQGGNVNWHSSKGTFYERGDVGKDSKPGDKGERGNDRTLRDMMAKANEPSAEGLLKNLDKGSAMDDEGKSKLLGPMLAPRTVYAPSYFSDKAPTPTGTPVTGLIGSYDTRDSFMKPYTGGPNGPGSYLYTSPPPVVVPGAKGEEKKDGATEGGASKIPGEGKPGGDTNNQPGKTEQPKPDPTPVVPENPARKIIRTGEMEFETDSFDNAVETVNKLIFNVKGAFIATVNSDKLPNGKMRGSVVVRMPPQFLDKFIFDLRKEITKSGELKNQRIGSQDVTKQYTDIESRLRAARAIEERLINIIKTGKGEIKDLVAAERELGIWRTKIEEMEGEIRYYSNQVALSTLTISLAEKEIQTPTAIVITETVTIRIEADEVTKAHQAAMKLVEEMKGRITRSELKQHTAGQFLSIVHAAIPPAKKDAFVEGLRKLGIVSDFQENQRQHTEGGTGPAPALKPKLNDVNFEVTMHNTANIRPRLSSDLKVATTDVPAAYTKLVAAILKAKGQVRDGKLNEQDKLNIHAQLDFNVPTTEKAAIDKLLDEIGPTLERINAQAPVSELSTDRKFGYTLLIRDFASIPARQTLVQIVAAVDVQAAYAKIQEAVAKAKGQMGNATLNEQDKLNVNAHVDFSVPADEKAAIEKLLADLGTVLSRNTLQTPINQLATPTKFGFAVVLRDVASIPPSKAMDLKVATNDVPTTYAKLLEAIAKAKGQVIDAKLNEQDKFNITAQIDFSVPTEERQAINTLLESLGSVLSRNNVQASANQLSIAKKFGFSILLRDFANILPSHASDMKIASNDVPKNYARLVEAVVKAKGQIRTNKLNVQDKLNVTGHLDFSVPTTEKPAFDKLLAEMGTELSRNDVQAPLNELTTDRKFGYAVLLRDFAAIPPRETLHLQLAAVDVPAAFRELKEAVVAAKGRQHDGQLLEDSKGRIEAKFEFDVPAAERHNLDKLFSKVGAILARTSSQISANDLATDQKVGYRLTIRGTAAIPPRETVSLKLKVEDVEARAAEIKAIVAAGKGRIIDSSIDRLENGQAKGVLRIEVPFASQDALLAQIKGGDKLVPQHTVRNAQVPENELTTTHIEVTLAGVNPIVPGGDEGLGSYVRASLAMSFKVFSVCLMLIILGVSAVLPWALVIWVVYKIYARLTNAGTMQLAPAGGPTPPSGEGPQG